jgi:beta-lactamase class A
MADRKVLKTAARMTLEGALLAAVITVAGQLAYPSSRALPQTYVGGKQYAYQSKQQIAADIAAVGGRPMHVTIGAQVLEPTPKQLGITLAGMEDAERAVSYSWVERLVPFSFLWEGREITYYSFTLDEAKAREFAVSLKQYDRQPVDAAVRVEGSRVIIDKQQNGYNYETDKIIAAIKGMKLTNGLSVALDPTIVQPKTTDQMAIEAGANLQQRLQQAITVSVEGKSVAADPSLIATWAVLAADAEDKKLSVTYDKEKVKQWLSSQLAVQVYVAATPHTVTLLDGARVGETAAADGRELNVEATADAVIAAASANRQTVEGKMQPVTAAARTIRNYSRSSQGLQALLSYFDQTHAGTWGIVLEDMNGTISASVNPDRQFTSASVYKIYVAYVVYDKLDSGELTMATPAGNGATVSRCLDIMIVRSDNACAHALGGMIGWNASDNLLQAKGLGSTTIAFDGQLTTARDAANYLKQLEKGTLMSAANREALLHKMGHNIYRYAIPAGSAGMHSANKLGALGVFNHDVAIVYHPKGTYVLSVFTQGSGHGVIRELARQISQVMNQ